MRPSALAVLLCLALPACGAAPTSARNSTDAPAPGASGAKDKPEVYDARGEARVCEAPRDSCTNATAPRELLDRCKLAGFRAVQCGCELFCTGNAMKERLYYDHKGSAKACAPVDEACEPPDTSAAFQDGCTDAGHKFTVCGCEWLCSGKPR